MTIDQIRLQNARRLAAEITTGRGQQAKFAERVGISRQLANNYIGPNPTKLIGDEMARSIESAFGMPRGWLDERHDDDKTNLKKDSVEIGAMNVGGLMAQLGTLVAPSVVQQMSVSRDWAKVNLKGAVSDYLAITSVGGQEGDVLPAGTTVLVDRGMSSVRSDGVYMLGRERGEGVWFRNVTRRLDGTIAICGENGADMREVRSVDELGIVVLGRVVATLELKPL